MTCEICGKKEGEMMDAIVEGAMLKVCSSCSKSGKVIPILKQPVVKEEKLMETKEDVEVIVSDYSEVVRKAREKKGLTQEELAKDLGEKESTIHHLESGNMKPNFKLANKLKVYLGIDLVEKVERIDVKKNTKDINFKDENLTIGDLLKK
jgi:putative transcription factor